MDTVLANAILGVSREAVCCLDPALDFRLIYANDAACNLFGRSCEQLLGMSPADWDPSRGLEARFRELRAEAPVTFEATLRTAEGHLAPVEMSARLFVHEGRQLCMCAVRRVSAHVRSGEAMERSSDALRLYVEHSPAAIAMLDRDMRYVGASRRYLADYGLGEQDLIGRSHYDVFPEIPERWKAVHRRCLAGAVESAEDDPFPRADGKVDWVRWEIRPWHVKPGEIGGVILFSEVITERKELEQRRRESEHRYRTLLDHAPVGIAVHSEGRIVFSNPAGAAILGAPSPEAVVGGPCRSLGLARSRQPPGMGRPDVRAVRRKGNGIRGSVPSMARGASSR